MSDFDYFYLTKGGSLGIVEKVILTAKHAKKAQSTQS